MITHNIWLAVNIMISGLLLSLDMFSICTFWLIWLDVDTAILGLWENLSSFELVRLLFELASWLLAILELLQDLRLVIQVVLVEGVEVAVVVTLTLI